MLAHQLEEATGPTPTWWWVVTAGAGALFFGLGALGIIWYLAQPIAYLILAISLAAAFTPLVRRIAHVMPRKAAIVVLYLALLLLVGGLAWWLLPRFVTEAQQFGQRLPDLFNRAQNGLMQLIPVDESSISMSESSMLNTLTSTFSNIGTRIVALPMTVGSTLLDAVLVIFLSLYALLLTPQIRQFLLSLAPEERRGRAELVMTGMVEAMGGYVRGVFFSGLIVATFTYIGLLIIGVDYSLVLGILAGSMEVVPIFGPLIAGIAIVAVALLHSTTQAIIALIFVIVLQQIESNILFPNILSREVQTSPLLNLFAFFAGVAVGGILGALVAVPLAAALRIFIIRVMAPGLRRWLGANPDEEYAPDADKAASA